MLSVLVSSSGTSRPDLFPVYFFASVGVSSGTVVRLLGDFHSLWSDAVFLLSRYSKKFDTISNVGLIFDKGEELCQEALGKHQAFRHWITPPYGTSVATCAHATSDSSTITSCDTIDMGLPAS